MSDTPRTDAVVAEINSKGYDANQHNYTLGASLYDHACKLERELAMAKKEDRHEVCAADGCELLIPRLTRR
jgi:hypothetical protein